MTNQEFQRKNQSGSILIWIFIGIVLFAALSFVMSQGFRSGEGQVSGSKADLAASEIITYANTVRDAVKHLQINGCNLYGGISFYHTAFQTPSIYTMAGVPDTCNVFSPSGGGINWQKPPAGTSVRFSTAGADFDEYGYAGFAVAFGFGSDVLLDGKDIILWLNVPKEVCAKVNEKVGNTLPGESIPTSNDGAWTRSISGWLSLGAFTPTIGSPSNIPTLNSKGTGCFYHTVGKYKFYSVLGAR